MKKTDLVSIELGVDTNNDFEFNETSEPKMISALNIRTRKIETVISDGIQHEIQGIMDGARE